MRVQILIKLSIPRQLVQQGVADRRGNVAAALEAFSGDIRRAIGHDELLGIDDIDEAYGDGDDEFRPYLSQIGRAHV